MNESRFDIDQQARPPAQRVRDGREAGEVMARLLAGTRRELLSLDDPSGGLEQQISERLLARAASLVRTAVDRVPTVRQLASRRGLVNGTELGTFARKSGGHARVMREIPFRMAVMDRTVAILPTDLDAFFNGLLISRDPMAVQALVRAHRSWWKTSEDPAYHERADGPPAHLALVLDCLLAGLTDDVAGARLYLSPRTYSRRVNELLTLLQTNSRFRAGAEAIRRGWA
ncbi:helix-turn-helix domain-containing protein [Streptomyces rimosus]|uniref:DNA-binding response regulator n=1 Tax=Streptomyces rimosus TaxID=1927 RepID=UPI001F1871A5|nr:DNA-binding response regulator [Streptomyces rimosus]